MKTVKIGVLVRDTGENTRTLQHWSDLGILRPEKSTDKQGRGNYRIYRAEPLHGERTWALLASACFMLRMPLGDIRDLIHVYRLMHDPMELLDKNDAAFERAFRDHRAEREEIQKSNPDFLPPFEAAIAGEPDIFAIVASRPNASARFSFIVRRGYQNMLDVMAENKSAVMLNLSKIFEPLRAPLILSADAAEPIEDDRKQRRA